MNKLRIFKKDILRIEKDIIISKDSFMQMDNITRVWFGKLKVSIPFFKLIVVLMVGMGSFTTPFAGLAPFLILGDIIAIAYYIYLWNHYSLSFELSSGQIYAFTTLDNEFLEKSYNEVKEIMNDTNKNGRIYEINFDKCDVNLIKDNNGTVNINNVDKSVNTNINSNNSNSYNEDSFNQTNINYELVSEELSKLLGETVVKENEKDVEMLKEAIILAMKQDGKGLKEKLKKLSKSTLTFIEASASFITLGQFISQLFK